MPSIRTSTITIGGLTGSFTGFTDSTNVTVDTWQVEGTTAMASGIVGYNMQIQVSGKMSDNTPVELDGDVSSIEDVAYLETFDTGVTKAGVGNLQSIEIGVPEGSGVTTISATLISNGSETTVNPA